MNFSFNLDAERVERFAQNLVSCGIAVASVNHAFRIRVPFECDLFFEM